MNERSDSFERSGGLVLSRSRKITADDILDAVERVVVRDGAANISIDAVAKEAGVSKSRVVYDHKSKSALLEALLERRVTTERKRVSASVEAHVDTPNPALFGRLALYDGMVANESDRAVAVAMVLAMAMPREGGLQEWVQKWGRSEFEAVASGARPRAGLVSYLALLGLYYAEVFAFHRWDDGERQRILDDVRKLYASFPET